MKIGVIGTGNMGKNHVRVYSEFKSVEELYVFDMNKDSANAMKEYGAIVCGSLEELLGKADAISICVPTKYHLDIAKRAIEKGVHCLIEKPITLTVKEGEELLALLKNKKLVVGVGHIERFNPVMDEIMKIIEHPLLIEMKRHNPTSSRITDSSVIEDLMIHDIDTVFNVLLSKERNYTIHSAWSPDVGSVIVSLNNSIISLSASRVASKKIRSIYIEDKKFTIDGDFMTNEIFVYWKPEMLKVENGSYKQENIIEKVFVNKTEPLKIELKTFIDCVANKKQFPVTPEQALRNLRICEEIKNAGEIFQTSDSDN